MSIFAVYKCYGDLCGNKERFLLGYCELEPEEAEKEFPKTPFVWYELDRIELSDPKELHMRFKLHRDR